MITIAFYKGPPTNWLLLQAHRLVCWRTSGPFSHCELIDAQGQGWTSSWRDGGVRCKQLDLDSGRWRLVEVPGDPAEALAWFEAHRGQSYDVFGLLGWVLPWRVSDRTRWFCSEAVAEAMGLAQTWRISPNDLFAMLTGERAQ